jgi:hypothetical protein
MGRISFQRNTSHSSPRDFEPGEDIDAMNIDKEVREGTRY